MSPAARVLVAVVLVLLGVMAAGPFGGGVRACFLPVAARMPSVSCEQVMGVPDVGFGRPVLALTIAVAAFMVDPSGTATARGWQSGRDLTATSVYTSSTASTSCG